jgi:hypothetical protein
VITTRLDGLMQAQQKAAEKLYAATGAPGGDRAGGPDAGAGPDGAGSTDDVIDAEVVEEKK